MDIDFEYWCPECGEAFIGSMSSDQTEYTKDIECEDCGRRYTLRVRVEINVTTE